METLVAPVQDVKFDIETALDMQLGAKPLPFAGMDSRFWFGFILPLLYFLTFLYIL